MVTLESFYEQDYSEWLEQQRLVNENFVKESMFTLEQGMDEYYWLDHTDE